MDGITPPKKLIQKPALTDKRADTLVQQKKDVPVLASAPKKTKNKKPIRFLRARALLKSFKLWFIKKVINSRSIVYVKSWYKKQLVKALKFYYKHQLPSRIAAGALAVLMVFSFGYEIYQYRFNNAKYELSQRAEQLLPKTNSTYAQKLKFDAVNQQYVYNQDYQVSADVAGQVNGPRFSGTFSSDPTKGESVKDVENSVNFTMTPKFGLDAPTQKENRLIYPLTGMDGAKVYTMRAASVKEDLIIEKYTQKKLDFKYELKLADGTEARLEKDGSIGVYGADSALLGNVSTSSDKDAELLQKARQNAKKTKLVFTIPAPFILDASTKESTTAKAWYTLDGNILTVHADKLDTPKYPITIDPSVYIDSAARLMRGNNESNIDFDVDNELIQKSQTTGARIDAWSSTTNLSSAVWGQGTAVAGGYIYSAGGVGSSTTTTTSISTVGANTFSVPVGITNITVKVWGGAGGGGAGTAGTGAGGAGGGGGYAKAVINVTPGETLDVNIGAGGTKAAANGNGGQGGTASTVKRSGTILLEGGAGGGGGGRRGNTGGTTGNGGSGGGSTGEAGTTGSTGGPGQGGTQVGGGTAGTAGAGGAAGRGGVSQGGGGGSPIATSCATVAASGNGSSGSGGNGGTYVTSCAPGGGGGGGYYGGGGGGSTSTNSRTGGGGGGGSSYINATGLVTGTDVNQVGSGTAPGNSGDSDRSASADGGTGGTSTAGATDGEKGIVVISYTTPGTISSSVYWAKFNTSTNAIESPNPGTGACTGWCNNSAYNLPAALKDLSLIAYNGYLYAIGGADSGGTPQTTVYIAKLGANGEPQLWHPTGGTAVYWYTDTALSNARSKFGAVAYNNRLYILGGLTTSSTVLSSNTVQYANINPTGTLSAWTTTGMYALSTTGSGNRYGLSAQVYNNTLYVIGGDATFSGTPVQSVDYSRLNGDGTMNPWVSTSSIQTSGRLTVGGSFSTIFGGYIYLAGGCSTVNASGYCTTIATDMQLASINADGSLSEWSTIIGLTNDRFAHTLIAWQGGLYRLGGCRAQDSVSGACTNTVLDVDYGVINIEGEASTVANSVASGTSSCSGGSPSGCDLPGIAIIGNVLSGSAILNGYLYIWGGCNNNTSGCGTVDQGVIYTSVGSDGSLTKPASCGSWTAVDSYCYNTTSLPGEVGAPGVAVFNGYIYSVGGFTHNNMVGNIYFAAPSLTDGSISSWGSVPIATGTNNAGATSVAYAYSFARANPSSASSVPGNLYILGGCTGSTGIGCSAYTNSVYKCNINVSAPFAYAPSSCTKTGQVQMDLSIGAMAGTIYANYIYLIGGLTGSDLTTTRYAKIDDSNNIVDASTGLSSGSWTVSGNQMYYARRRGSGFGYNGYLYVVGGYDGTGGGGILADIEFTKIDVSDGSIGTWHVSSVSVQQRWGLTLTVSNSYAYVIGGCISGNAPTCNAAGQTDSIQTFQIYNNDSGAVKSYTSASDDTFSTATDRWGASSAIYTDSATEQSYLYVAGGCIVTTDCSGGGGGINTTSDVQYIPLSKTDGSFSGSWASTSNVLPAARAWGKLVNVNNTLYYIGGQNDAGTAQSTVYYVSSFSSGNINAAWSTATKGLGDTGSGGNARTKFGIAVWDSRIYVLGGYSSAPATTATVYISPKQSAGGNITSNWSSGTAFNVARYGAATTAYANNLYLFGGNNGTNYLNDGQFATFGYKTGTISQSTTTVTGSGTTFTSAMVGSKIQYPDGSTANITAFTDGTHITVDASKTVSAGTIYTVQDGSINAWKFTTSTPGYVSQGEAFGANGYMYIIGGRSAASTCTPNTLVAPISANTTIATGNNPTGVGDWYETNVRYTGDRYGAAVSYNNGKFYLMGGGCTAPLTSTRHYYATVKSQPQVAIYSRMIDTDTDVFPTKWLLNGLDNSIGARWQLKYRSMHDTSSTTDTVNGVLQQNPNEDCGTSATMPVMTTWGKETNVGDVTLGVAGTYTPKESGGSNINCARYYYFSISIDASQTYGYPEDVNRGPTISDVSLFFTADPSKRLRHGKTFTGGELQPLDTPF